MEISKIKKLVPIIAVLAVFAITTSIFFFTRNNEVVMEGPQGKIAADETNSANWGKVYPVHWDSYQANLGNSENPSHFTTKPYMEAIYAGTGFAAEFNEPRGHLYTIEDVTSIDPARQKAGASCFTCKSTQVPETIEKYGAQYYLMSFDEMKSQITEPIGCLDCHDSEAMALRISRPALIEALERQGRDISKITHQEMRSLVCAQCHVTYYFEPGTKKVTFPWDNGVSAEEILSYYDEKGFTEWAHPIAGSSLVKARHAEYETFIGSTHQSAGLACADCHMPYTMIGNTKISSHVWQSPLNNIEQSCTTCHRNGVEWLTKRVETIQTQVKESQALAGAAMVEAINELKIARESSTVDKAKLQEAMVLHREAQWYLDYVMVTNGYGFHNPTATLYNLNTATDKAHRAIEKAREARGAHSVD